MIITIIIIIIIIIILLENEDYKLLWDFSVRTDHEIGARRPDLVIIDKSDELSDYRCGNSRG